jgi:WD repeat-containing protein 19
MEHLDIGLAIQVYRDIGDAGMVQALERIIRIEDRMLLSGHVHLLFSQFESAQERFLASSRPETALEMRRDLLNWDHALKLAGSIAPGQVPVISYEYGQQLEFKGEYALAMKMYASACKDIEQSLSEIDTESKMNSNGKYSKRRTGVAVIIVGTLFISCNYRWNTFY